MEPFTEHPHFRPFIAFVNSVVSGVCIVHAACAYDPIGRGQACTVDGILFVAFMNQLFISVDEELSPPDFYLHRGFKTLVHTAYLALMVFNILEIHLKMGEYRLNPEWIPLTLYVTVIVAFVQRIKRGIYLPVGASSDAIRAAKETIVEHMLVLTILMVPLMWTLLKKMYTTLTLFWDIQKPKEIGPGLYFIVEPDWI